MTGAARASRTADDLLEVARERFGYEDFRPGQREAIEAVLGGRDALAVMPTGSGKSAIYQIAALEIPGSIEAADLAGAAASRS